MSLSQITEDVWLQYISTASAHKEKENLLRNSQLNIEDIYFQNRTENDNRKLKNFD